MVYSGSRGGVVFLFGGILLWLLGLGRKRWSIPLAVSVSGILLAALIFFIVSKGEARNRLLDQLGLDHDQTKAHIRVSSSSEVETEPTLDGRILIFQDTWRMIQDAPLTGVGLGAFRYVFPQYGNASLSESTSVHPESDWLMLAAEAGLPAVVVAVAMTFILLSRVASQREHAYWPLRWGVLCAVLAALAHGMVDVPIHRVALGWWVCLFAGAGLQTWPATETPPRLWERIIFWLTGLLALTLGIWMVGAEWKGFRSTPPFAAAKDQAEILRLFQSHQLEKASNLASEAIARSPMAHALYLQKGILELNYEGTEKEVDGYFSAERALNPDWVRVPIQQGIAWMQVDQQRTLLLWKDAIARSQRLDASPQGSKDHLRRTYETLLQQSASYPDLLRALREPSRGQAGLTLLWLRTVPNALAASEFKNIAGEDATLSPMSAAERLSFLQLWYQKGDRAALFQFIETHPDWKDAAWPVQIRQLVDDKKFQEAVQNVTEHHHLDLSLPTPGTGKTLSYPEEIENPLEKFTFYWKSGNEVTARRILEEARVQAEKSAKKSPEVWRTCAALAIHDQRWDAAWSWLQRYLRDSGLDASF
ncbi:MAG: O-antigen ligase family protein [Chthoniobacterales bacterium]